jgi:two-component system, OmpR family, phosphate regulon response regulator PhoB
MRPKPRILIVEDEEGIATGLQWNLEAEGMSVRVVGRASEVLPAIDDFKPDVLLLDLSLPDANGREVYEWVKGRLPVIFSTGSFSERELVEHSIGDATVLMKPYTTEDLLRTIDRVHPSRDPC